MKQTRKKVTIKISVNKDSTQVTLAIKSQSGPLSLQQIEKALMAIWEKLLEANEDGNVEN